MPDQACTVYTVASTVMDDLEPWAGFIKALGSAHVNAENDDETQTNKHPTEIIQPMQIRKVNQINKSKIKVKCLRNNMVKSGVFFSKALAELHQQKEKNLKTKVLLCDNCENVST